MNISFILFVGFRYFKEKRKSKKIASSVLSITGIAVGVMTLTAVIGVMNGFQLSFIEPILNIGSYHIQIHHNDKQSEPGKAGIAGEPEIGGHLTQPQLDAGGVEEHTLSEIRAIPEVTALVPFVENQALIEGKTACIVRGIPQNIKNFDPSFQQSFDLDYYDMPDEETLKDKDSVLIGNQMAIHLGLRKGDFVSITTFGGTWSSKKKVTGIFQTWYYDIDKTWIFVSLDTARGFYKDQTQMELIYGVKIKDKFSDNNTISKIKGILNSNYEVKSWREFNRSFFGALLMEKVLMMVLVGLIFIVVGFNIFHSLKRSVYERKEEIALLKALGASPVSIKNIFIIEGFLIGILGCFFGILSGLLIANNINEIFKFTEDIINNFLFSNIESFLKQLNIHTRFSRVSIFSPDIFYIKNVPIRILFPETFLICFFAMLCSYLAAFFASRKVVIIKPAEILRYE